MSFYTLAQLLGETESEWLDFKEMFHENTVKLVHDVLCLSNSYAETDRYLVFGVADDKTVVGIETDPYRKTNAQIQDLLSASHFNRIPTVNLSVVNHSGHEIAILEMRNRPDKPFFLTQDKVNGKDRIRAGVVYTRLGDTNTPLMESAPEDHVELMWRERFGLGLSPLERLSKLVEDQDAWQKVQGDSYLYHRDFPEFIITIGPTVHDDFQEEWVKTFPDPHASSFYVDCKYLGTTLQRCLFVRFDGGRYQLPIPKLVGDGSLEIDTSSLDFKIAELYKQYLPLREILPKHGIKLI
jgi:Putative DNA-binding domain